MPSRTAGRVAVSILMLAAVVSSCPAVVQDSGAGPSDELALQWLSEAPRQEIRASVQVSPARLNFAQRLAFVIHLTIPGRALQSASVHRELYVVAKAGDGTRWLPDGSHARYELTRPLNRRDELEFVNTVYARPGRWVLGIVLYDAVLKQRSVFIKTINIERLKHDPLPRLDDGLPEIQFLDEAAATDVSDPRPSRRMRADNPVFPPSYPPAGAAPNSPPRPAQVSRDATILVDSPREVSLNLKRPMVVDVLVDFTPSAQYSGSNRVLRWTQSAFWAVTHVLSELRSPNLCMRVTGIDVIGRHVLFQRMDGSNMDWATIAQELARIDANTVDVETLEHRTQSAIFFRNAVEDLLSHPDAGCGSSSAAGHVYIIAASGILFPSGTPSTPIEGSATRLYYLRAHLLWNDQWDAMAKIVKPLHPRLLAISDPLQFRKALKTIVDDLEAGAPVTQTSTSSPTAR